MERGLVTLAAALGFLLCLPVPAMAQQTQRSSAPGKSTKATPAAAPLVPPRMKVRHVRSNLPGCEPTCAEWISAEGLIDASSPGEFRKVLTRLGDRRLPVLIDSPGGSLDPSFTIARLIRARGLDVVVTRTVLAPCVPADTECLALKARGIELGRPEARISKCASACAFVLAGGVRRYVGSWTVVGLHEIRAVHTRRLVRQHFRIERPLSSAPRKMIVRQETVWSERVEGPADEQVYARVRKFFASMGVTDGIMPILRSAPNTSIRWVSSEDLRATALATDFINGEQLLHETLAPSPPVDSATTALSQPGAAVQPPPSTVHELQAAAAVATPVPAARPSDAGPAAASPTTPASYPAATVARFAKAVSPAKPKPLRNAGRQLPKRDRDTSWQPF